MAAKLIRHFRAGRRFYARPRLSDMDDLCAGHTDHGRRRALLRQRRQGIPRADTLAEARDVRARSRAPVLLSTVALPGAPVGQPGILGRLYRLQLLLRVRAHRDGVEGGADRAAKYCKDAKEPEAPCRPDTAAADVLLARLDFRRAPAEHLRAVRIVALP